MCLAQGPQRSDAGEARTRGPSVSSQALYHWEPLKRGHKYIKRILWIIRVFNTQFSIQTHPGLTSAALPVETKWGNYETQQNIEKLKPKGTFSRELSSTDTVVNSSSGSLNRHAFRQTYGPSQNECVSRSAWAHVQSDQSPLWKFRTFIQWPVGLF